MRSRFLGGNDEFSHGHGGLELTAASRRGVAPAFSCPQHQVIPGAQGMPFPRTFGVLRSGS